MFKKSGNILQQLNSYYFHYNHPIGLLHTRQKPTYHSIVEIYKYLTYHYPQPFAPGHYDTLRISHLNNSGASERSHVLLLRAALPHAV